MVKKTELRDAYGKAARSFESYVDACVERYGQVQEFRRDIAESKIPITEDEIISKARADNQGTLLPSNGQCRKVALKEIVRGDDKKPENPEDNYVFSGMVLDAEASWEEGMLSPILGRALWAKHGIEIERKDVNCDDVEWLRYRLALVGDGWAHRSMLSFFEGYDNQPPPHWKNIKSNDFKSLTHYAAIDLFKHIQSYGYIDSCLKVEAEIFDIPLRAFKYMPDDLRIENMNFRSDIVSDEENAWWFLVCDPHENTSQPPVRLFGTDDSTDYVADLRLGERGVRI